MSEEQARPVPIHIDTSDVLGEVIIIFVAVFALGNAIRVVVGGQDEGMFWILAAATASAVVYSKQRVGKPDGFLYHQMARYFGIKSPGLLPKSLKKIRR
jgi:hypothetical protein